MTWLFPVFLLHKTDKSIAGEDVYVTDISFPTRFVLQNWNNRLIMEVRIFGFGFKKVFLYE